jgi:hypothetical protein
VSTQRNPIGTGHAQAMARLGLKELRNALNPSRDSVADTEIGLYGSQTQGEIAQARSGPGQGPEQEAVEMVPPQSAEKSSLAELRAQTQELQQQQRDAQQEPQREQGREA